MDGTWTEEMEQWRQEAESGDTDAMCNLGWSFFDNKDIPDGLEISMKYFRNAADMGNKEAICHTARCYEGGLGVEENKDEALKWYNEAIELYNKEIADGDKAAIESLAFLYLRGSFGLLDKEKGLELYKELAKAGNVSAMFDLGRAYLGEFGVEKDMARAYEWFRKAADNGDSLATNYLDTDCNEDNGNNGWNR